MPIGILGTGAHVPRSTVSNAQIAEWSDVDPGWIVERTGVRERRYAEPHESTSSVAEPAARQAIEAAGGGEVGLIAVATSTPDQPQPATAVMLQHRLGLSGSAAFDLNAVCSGFVYALAAAHAMTSTGSSAGRALVVGADLYSRIMNQRDPKTVSLFGDAAGAVLLGEVPEGYGVHACVLAAHGEYQDYVGVPAGGTREPLTPETLRDGRHLFGMDGRAVRDYVMEIIPKIVDQVLADTGWRRDEVDRFVFHQANARLLGVLAERLGVTPDRTFFTAPHLGNTAAASVPVTLHEMDRARPIADGERIVLASVGGGMTAGAAALTWHRPAADGGEAR
ncbi:3-oxoacyl-ACP synthase III family protein [Actinomadura roseirufa]|uniref:3-oxoacyl-ACP synthase III family protein n=1 Tax=Actinomadura roseirufa TaxID=2094049 RepID=UPI0010418607|nr:ketoacyl-ACP synthase III [Actinomadura roseirufa]